MKLHYLGVVLCLMVRCCWAQEDDVGKSLTHLEWSAQLKQVKNRLHLLAIIEFIGNASYNTDLANKFQSEGLTEEEYYLMGSVQKKLAILLEVDPVLEKIMRSIFSIDEVNILECINSVLMVYRHNVKMHLLSKNIVNEGQKLSDRRKKLRKTQFEFQKFSFQSKYAGIQ